MRAKYNRLSREVIDSPIYFSRDGTIIFNGNVPIWPGAITSVSRAFALTRLGETLGARRGDDVHVGNISSPRAPCTVDSRRYRADANSSHRHDVYLYINLQR